MKVGNKQGTDQLRRAYLDFGGGNDDGHDCLLLFVRELSDCKVARTLVL